VILLALVLLATREAASHQYPKTACFLPGHATMADCVALSRYDLVILSTGTYDLYPGLPDSVRSLNPDVIILAYYPCSYVWSEYESMPPTPAAYGYKVEECDWWLYDTKGHKIRCERGFHFTNFSPVAPLDDTGQTIGEWLAHQISQEVVSTGVWDGVFIDGPFSNIYWVNEYDHLFVDPPAWVDADRDGQADDRDTLGTWWSTMLESFLQTLRQDIGYSYILLGNGYNDMSQYLQGGACEAFPNMLGSWENSMYGPYGFATMSRDWLQDPMNVTMMICYYNNEENTKYEPRRTVAYERFLRFTLTSALLSDGYYYLGDPHWTLWWEDLYDLDLGDPTADAYRDSVWNSVYSYYCPIWVREYEKATVICNPGPRYAILPDGTWIYPEDGLIQSHVSPCCLDIEIDRPHTARTFDRRGWGLEYTANIVNASDNAAYGYVWARLTDHGDTVVAGNIREFLIGAGDSVEKPLSLRVLSALPVGTYCLEVFVGGPDYVPTGHDTVYVRRSIDFYDAPRKNNDGTEEGDLGVHFYPSVTRDGRTRMEVTGSSQEASLRSVKIYDVRGRLVSTVFEGELMQSEGLEIDLMAEGGESFTPGVYFVSAELKGETYTGKIVLLR
jgi:hypothetical protein